MSRTPIYPPQIFILQDIWSAINWPNIWWVASIHWLTGHSPITHQTHQAHPSYHMAFWVSHSCTTSSLNWMIKSLCKHFSPSISTDYAPVQGDIRFFWTTAYVEPKKHEQTSVSINVTRSAISVSAKGRPCSSLNLLPSQQRRDKNSQIPQPTSMGNQTI